MHTITFTNSFLCGEQNCTLCLTHYQAIFFSVTTLILLFISRIGQDVIITHWGAAAVSLQHGVEVPDRLATWLALLNPQGDYFQIEREEKEGNAEGGKQFIHGFH